MLFTMSNVMNAYNFANVRNGDETVVCRAMSGVCELKEWQE